MYLKTNTTNNNITTNEQTNEQIRKESQLCALQVRLFRPFANIGTTSKMHDPVIQTIASQNMSPKQD